MQRVGLIQTILDFIRNKHLYRKASFNKMSALYISRVLRVVALNLSSVFIYIYLYNNGSDIFEIIGFMLFYYGFRMFTVVPMGVILAKIGSRKMLLLGNLLQAPMLVLFTLTDKIGIKAVILGMIFKAFGEVSYSLAHNIIFSEVKNRKNSGKEIGFMMIFEKIAIVVTPLIGALMMTYLNPRVTIWVSSVLLVVASMPLFVIKGLDKKGYYLNFRGFPWRAYNSIFFGQLGRGFIHISSAFLPVFIASFVAVKKGGYGIVGISSSITAFFGLVVAFLTGKILDKSDCHKQRKVFKASVVLVALGVLMTGAIKDDLTIAITSAIFGFAMTIFAIVYSKGRYDAADKCGSRVLYEIIIHLLWSLSCFISTVVLYLILKLNPLDNLELNSRLFYLVSAVGVLSMLFITFPLYRKKELES